MDQPQQPQISPELIKKGTLRECPDCESILFDTTTAIVKISKIMSPIGEEIEVPIRVIVCKSCGAVPDWSDPDNLLPTKIKNLGKK